MTERELDDYLRDAAEPAYAAFSRRMTPTAYPILGVRIPALRKIAASAPPPEAIAPDSFEKVMVRGFATARLKLPPDDYAARVEAFLPLIDNWAVCDSFCNSLAPRFPGDGAALWDFLRPLYPDSREYYARVACVVQLSHFVDSEHLEEGLSLLQQVKHPGYYAKMAAAWALSEWYVKFPQAVGQLLAQQTLEPWVQNKAIQKVRESRRVSKAEKDALLRYKLQPTP